MEGHLALDYVIDDNGSWATKGAALKWYRKELAAKQAEIDRLMLEYCPNDMTPEQLLEWERNQKPVSVAQLLEELK